MYRSISRIVVLGDGLLGSEIVRQTGWDLISRKKDQFDITNVNCFNQLLEFTEGACSAKYDVIVNCIANTDTYSTDRQKHWNVNYKGTADLVDFCNLWNIKLVHISSDYVYAKSLNAPTELDVPVHQETHYAHTKLLADGYVELKSNNYLICRCTHKPTPFPYENAWVDQIGNFDYVDVIADLIIKVIGKNAQGTYNIGTPTKNMWSLAKQTNPNVGMSYCGSNYKIPNNLTMNLNKLNKLLNEN